MSILKDDLHTSTGPSLTVIMPTISWVGVFPICVKRLKALVETEICAGFPMESIIVFDGPLQPPPPWLAAPHLRLVATGRRSGPAAARNLAAQQATGEVLVFVDADVELHAESLFKIRQAFLEDPSLDAIFGSYDDAPAAPGVVSRFRNLLHHYTHQNHAGSASTFWAGCGAMRRDVFLRLGGFDTAYHQPSIEDVELGLRLWRQGGHLVLDPSIQGCHHKRWTLHSMVITDIRQRAMPWSQLLLAEKDTPATLNLSLRGRISGALAPLVPLGLVLTVLPGGLVAGPLLATTALVLLTILNHSFHCFHARRCGWPDAIAGMGLHLLHLCCASGTFAWMATRHVLQKPLTWPLALRQRPALRQGLVLLALLTLALLGLLAISKGLVLGWSNAKDLRERWPEWELFRQGHFPMGGIYGGDPPPGLRTSPYPMWAIPLFALFFVPWGLPQGILTIQVLSLVCLAFIAWIGYQYLAPHGTVAGWFGALAPIAISGNSNALAVAQFSILCMGLVFMEWRQLSRQRPLAAGVSWALAMIKPQISLLHVTPLVLNKSQRKGLWSGLLTLALLSVVAMLHTRLSPFVYGLRFFRVLGKVQDDSGWNLSLQLSHWGAPTWAILVGASLGGTLLWRSWLDWRRQSPTASVPEIAQDRWMILAGLCSLLGYLGFYHRSTDLIMLAPALLALADLSWRWRRLGITSLTLLMGTTVWTPARLLHVSPVLHAMQHWIWWGSALVLAMSFVLPLSPAPKFKQNPASRVAAQ
ncbi:MAG: glycosyltransferase [Cyanobacteria bacterium K_Offshore_surface_m2_239]|nr:glycosyltransferase [Cyanobacteria bacterium K_Offshore_surface_m2_239]